MSKRLITGVVCALAALLVSNPANARSGFVKTADGICWACSTSGNPMCVKTTDAMCKKYSHSKVIPGTGFNPAEPQAYDPKKPQFSFSN